MDTRSSAYASYRRFLVYFAENVDPTDQLPVRVPNFTLNESEITGAVTDWIIQYLNDKWVIRVFFINIFLGESTETFASLDTVCQCLLIQKRETELNEHLCVSVIRE